jgi:SET domain-containing protein
MRILHRFFIILRKTAAPIDDAYVKKIPVVRPVEMIKALKEATELTQNNFGKSKYSLSRVDERTTLKIRN